MRYTIDELLRLMRAKPFTLTWNAIIAYDRTKANKVLLQEYISRFNTASYFPPFSDPIPTVAQEVEWVYNFLVDTPRMSFEISDIKRREVKLHMKVLGGTQLTITTESGRAAAISRVAVYDALQAADFDMNIDLEETGGSVDREGQVVLNLVKGRGPMLYFGPTRNQREKGGAYMLNKIKALRPEITVYVINELKNDAGQFLQIKSFEIRIHAEPGAKVARAANFGEGAVLMFVTMEGENNGLFPATDEDFDFLIPQGDYSSTTMLEQEFVIKRLLAKGLENMAEGSPFDCQYEYESGPSSFIRAVNVTAGSYKGPGVSMPVGDFPNVTIDSFNLPMGGDFKLSMVRLGDDNLLQIDWRGTAPQVSKITPPGGLQQSGSLTAAWDISVHLKFVLVDETGELKLEVVPGGQQNIKMAPGTFVNIPAVANAFSRIVTALEDSLLTALQKTSLEKFIKVVETVDAFRLNNLLFRGDNIVHFTSAHSPGDLAMFGELAPELNLFAVDPLEPVIGHSTTKTFYTDPDDIPGVTWSVEKIEGHTGDAGEINVTTGEYTAPPQSALDGPFIRVRIKASTATHHSYALVTVVALPITINPLVQSCNASTPEGSQKREVAAGALGGGTLTWSTAGSTGSSVVPSIEDGGDHTFIAPPKSADPKVVYTLEEIVVRKGTLRESSWVLVIHKIVSSQASIDRNAGLPANKVKLLLDSGDGPHEGVTWTVLKGGGTVDQATGVYTMGALGTEPFALITGFLKSPVQGWPDANGHIILPLPLIDFPTLVTALDKSEVYFKAAARVGMDEAARIAGLS